jgi:hypothetical protein
MFNEKQGDIDIVEFVHMFDSKKQRSEFRFGPEKFGTAPDLDPNLAEYPLATVNFYVNFRKLLHIILEEKCNFQRETINQTSSNIKTNQMLVDGAKYIKFNGYIVPVIYYAR